MNDFGSDDFMNKNVRVRPVSGRTNMDESGKIQDNYPVPSRNMMMLTENTEDEEQKDKMAILEMEDQRKTIKKEKKVREDTIAKKKKQEQDRRGAPKK